MTVAEAQARTVEDLQSAVERALWEYDLVRPALPELSVQAHADGSVEVIGHVRTGVIRDGVIETLRRVPGVTQVVDQLYSDQELEIAVAIALSEIDKLSPGALTVHAHLGDVTLLGRLPEDSLRDEVLSVATSVVGVDRVIDRLQVRR